MSGHHRIAGLDDIGVLEDARSSATAEEPPPTRRGGVGRNTLLNLAGLLTSSVVAIVTVPLYLSQIGEERYGVLVLVWVVIGSFGVLDLGLGRATANRVARVTMAGQLTRESRAVGDVVWTGFGMAVVVGLVAASALYALGARVLPLGVSADSSELVAEALTAIPWLALAVVFTVAVPVLNGALEGAERFLTMNLLAIAASVAAQVIPLLYAAWRGPALNGLIAVTACVATVNAVVLAAVVYRTLNLPRRPRPDRREARTMLGFGGWVTVNGLAVLVLGSVDRLVVGGTLGARAVTVYSVPYAVIARMSAVPVALARALFPRLSALGANDARDLSVYALRALVAFMTPLAVVAIVVAEPLLELWIGEELARESAPVAEILVAGFWINSLAVVPFAYLPARGRPDLPAKLSVLELLPFLLLLYLATRSLGVKGAALAWTIRALVDAVLLLVVARLAPIGTRRDKIVAVLAVALVTATCALSLTVFSDDRVRGFVGGMLCLASVAFGWAVAPEELRGRLTRRAVPAGRPSVGA